MCILMTLNNKMSLMSITHKVSFNHLNLLIVFSRGQAFMYSDAFISQIRPVTLYRKNKIRIK